MKLESLLELFFAEVIVSERLHKIDAKSTGLELLLKQKICTKNIQIGVF
jgi:hypothetical protein